MSLRSSVPAAPPMEVKIMGRLSCFTVAALLVLQVFAPGVHAMVPLKFVMPKRQTGSWFRRFVPPNHSVIQPLFSMGRRSKVQVALACAGGTAILGDLHTQATQGNKIGMDPVRIAVVGGGLSGLATAYFLRKHGGELGDKLEIKVLEASNRVGGRVRTLRDFDKNLYAEAGALSITDRESLMLSLAKEMGLEVIPRPDRGKKRCFRNGSFADCAPISEYMAILSDKIQQLRDEGIIQQPDDWATKNSEVLDDLDSVSIVTFFVRLGKDPSETKIVLGSSLVGLSTDDLDDISALHAMRFMSQYVGCRSVYSIADGSDRLPQALADFLNQKQQTVFLKSPVETVVREGKLWRVSFASGDSEVFNYIVMAVPLTALQSHGTQPIQLPDLPQERVDALNAIRSCESIARVYCEVDDRFWCKKPPYPSTAMTITDHPTLWIEDHTACQKGNYAVLEAHACGPVGFEIRRASDANRAGEQQIALVYGEEFNRHLVPEKTTTVLWSNEPYQWGAYPYFRPGQRRLLAALSEPLEGLFFVGEYTCLEAPASMYGAVLSADRVVKHKLLPVIRETCSR